MADVTSNLDSKHDLASCIDLSNGVKMPRLGLGLSHNNGGFSVESVKHALKIGVRLFDTARRYGNEEQLGECLKRSGVPREQVFITSKMWPGDVDETQDDMGVTAAFEGSLKRLGVDKLDLYLVHYPGRWNPSEPPKTPNRAFRARLWRQFEGLLKSGRCRAIGVSNFTKNHLEQLIADCDVVPHVNQIEFNPFQNPGELVSFCQQNKIVVEGYCPLAKASATLLEDPEIVKIAAAYNKTVPQVLIRWNIEKDVIVIPKSRKPHRIDENTNVFDFALSREHFEYLDSVDRNLRSTWDPSDIE